MVGGRGGEEVREGGEGGREVGARWEGGRRGRGGEEQKRYKDKRRRERQDMFPKAWFMEPHYPNQLFTLS